MVIGGLAVMAHGVQRFTKDLDICPGPPISTTSSGWHMFDRADARQLGLGDFDERGPRPRP